MPDTLPPELRAFIFSCIDSIEQLEILSLLHRSGSPWSTRAVAAQLGFKDAAARHHLESLLARGLLKIEVGEEAAYRYAPRTPVLAGYTEQLAAFYEADRIAVLRFIATRPQSVRSFADAFKLRDSE